MCFQYYEAFHETGRHDLAERVTEAIPEAIDRAVVEAAYNTGLDGTVRRDLAERLTRAIPEAIYRAVYDITGHANLAERLAGSRFADRRAWRRG